jgi:hypothetical protein
MAFDWLIGIGTNLFSSAIWDGAKGAFGAGRDDQVLSLGLEQPASLIQAAGSGRQAADLATLERIQNLLPSTETIQYLRDHSFGNAHRGAFLEPLDRFLEQTGGPEDQFLTPTLERMRQELRTAISTFQRLIAKYTFRHLQPDMYEIPGEWERDKERRSTFFEAIRSINAAAEDVTLKYDALVQAARKDLII